MNIIKSSNADRIKNKNLQIFQTPEKQQVWYCEGKSLGEGY